ncbi:MAG: hypothetical protein WKF74_05535 [Pyrinomonadaceae bacterium]
MIMLLVGGIITGVQSLLGIKPAPTNTTAPVSTALPSPSQPQAYPSPLTTDTRTDTDSYNGTDRVHVRGYYRKDGTYVRPHTRRTRR